MTERDPLCCRSEMSYSLSRAPACTWVNRGVEPLHRLPVMSLEARRLRWSAWQCAATWYLARALPLPSLTRCAPAMPHVDPASRLRPACCFQPSWLPHLLPPHPQANGDRSRGQDDEERGASGRSVEPPAAVLLSRPSEPEPAEHDHTTSTPVSMLPCAMRLDSGGHFPHVSGTAVASACAADSVPPSKAQLLNFINFINLKVFLHKISYAFSTAKTHPYMTQYHTASITLCCMTTPSQAQRGRRRHASAAAARQREQGRAAAAAIRRGQRTARSGRGGRRQQVRQGHGSASLALPVCRDGGRRTTQHNRTPQGHLCR